MQWLKAYQPPAFLADLANVRNGLAQWDEFVSRCFTAAIDNLRITLPGGQQNVPQFFDAKQPGYSGLAALVEEPIVWNAFPKTLVSEFGRDGALVHGDVLWSMTDDDYRLVVPDSVPLPTAQIFRRPQDEYCEWRVEHDAATGKIVRIVFTCEPPEYWTALFGGTVNYGRNPGEVFRFEGNPGYATELYRSLTGQDVRREDLALSDGSYNRFNRWNTTHGIVHLANIPNSIAAEVQLAADSTIRRARLDGTLVTQADELICRAGFGTPGRNSDPTIGAAGNALARLGARVTLANPVGIYMDDLDVNGWELADGTKPADCWRLERGQPGMMERIVVEVPKGSGLMVGDITIGGERVRFGGQIAECITIKLLGAGDIRKPVDNGAASSPGMAYLPRLGPDVLFGQEVGMPCPAGMHPAFERSVPSAFAASPAAVRPCPDVDGSQR